MDSKICALCGSKITGNHHMMDVDNAEGDEFVCDMCHTNLFDEFDGAKGDDGDE